MDKYMDFLLDPAFLLSIGVVMGVLFGVPIAYLKMNDCLKDRLRRSLVSVFEEYYPSETDSYNRQRTVKVNLYVYQSFLLPLASQWTIPIYVSPDPGLQLIKDVFWINIKWNWMSLWFPWIALVSFITYFQQKRTLNHWKERVRKGESRTGTPDENEVDVIYQYRTDNRSYLDVSKEAGCFFCVSTFSPDDITDWQNEEPGDTALCPECDNASVLPSSRVEISRELLENMHIRWFGPYIPIEK